MKLLTFQFQPIFLLLLLLLLVLNIAVLDAADDGGGGGDDKDPDAEKKKANDDKVKPLLEQHQKKMRARLDELAKKQEGDQEFQKLTKDIVDARKAHPDEENPSPKDIPQLNAGLDGLFQSDIKLNEEQAVEIVLTADDDDNGQQKKEDEGNKAKSGDAERRRRRRRRRRGAAINSASTPARVWPSAIVPYVFAASVPTATRTTIQKAMNMWQTKSCLTFQENAAATNKLYFTTASAGCWSWVGRQTQWAQQEVSIGAGCDYVGIIAHEIGHALGFNHEQTRHDRDPFVAYNAANVQTGQESNFAKETTATNNNYGLAYDYGSVMHYADTDFSANGQPVLVALLGAHWQRTMGQQMGPSFYDIRMMNALYSCQARCPTPVACYNGGIQNPRACTQCLCPPGVGGADCGLVNPAPINAGYAPPGVPNTCTGTTIKALGTAQELTGQIGTTNVALQPTKSDHAWCHWFISADVGYKIAIEVLEVGNYCAKGCFYGNTEIRVWDGNDWGKTGPRLCCASDLGSTGKLTMSTPSTRAMISLYASQNVQRFRIRFWQYAAGGK